jgi:hypothetical protein
MFWARQARPLWMVHSDLSLFWKSDRVSAHESPFSDPTLWRFSHLSCSLFCPSFSASGKLARKVVREVATFNPDAVSPEVAAEEDQLGT